MHCHLKNYSRILKQLKDKEKMLGGQFNFLVKAISLDLVNRKQDVVNHKLNNNSL